MVSFTYLVITYTYPICFKGNLKNDIQSLAAHDAQLSIKLALYIKGHELLSKSLYLRQKPFSNCKKL